MSVSGSTPEETEPRRIAGRYRLTAPLGSGAMGTVWAGYDEVLHRSVAIKELKVPPGVPQGEVASMRERMMREARTLGGLSHPNVITLYDVVDVSGDPFVVMELLPSRNLSEVIGEQGRLGVGQAASVGLAMTAALQAAHRAGITHRDVKPGNVLVAHDGRIKLTDFGIARKTNDVTMTQTGLVLGSPAYIAPEVASGLPVTPAADLWGLGATLFAAVEARPPYDVDGDPVKTVTAVVHAQVPRVQMGGPLGEVISALMVKDPEQRMSLVEARRRLRPLLADPDDPLFPGSVDAYSPPPGPVSEQIGQPAQVRGDGGTSAPPRPKPGGDSSTPRPRPRPNPAPAASSQWASAAPLAPDPGPLPTGPRADLGTGGGAMGNPSMGNPPMSNQVMNNPIPGGGPLGNPSTRGRPSWQPAPPPRPPVNRPTPPPVAAQAGVAGRWALPFVLAGALAVVLGTAGGWAGTRVLVGQSPLTTAVVSPAGGGSSAGTPMTNHTDSAQRYGAGALNFTATVPLGWEEYRLIGGNDLASVRFVSPDGAREVRIDKLVGNRAQPARAADFNNGLTAGVLGVAKVVVQQVPPNQVRYWTDRTGSQGTSSRFSYAQLTPVADDVWVIQLTVPADRAGADSEQLFTSIAQGFHP